MTQELRGDASHSPTSDVSEAASNILETNIQSIPESTEASETLIAQSASLSIGDSQVFSGTETQKLGNGFLQQAVQRFRAIAPWLWAIVIVVVLLPKIGELFIAQSFGKPLPDRTPITLTTPSTTLDWQQTEKLLVRALRDAHQSAEGYASKKLDAWVDGSD